MCPYKQLHDNLLYYSWKLLSDELALIVKTICQPEQVLSYFMKEYFCFSECCYLATLSSHFTINNIVNIESIQAITKTDHVSHIGTLSYSTAPINNN